MTLTDTDEELLGFLEVGLPIEFSNVRVELDRLSGDSGINIQLFFTFNGNDLRADYSFHQEFLDCYTPGELASVVINWLLEETNDNE